MINFTETDDSLIFAVRVIPRASKTEIVGEYQGALKIKESENLQFEQIGLFK